MPPAIDRRSHGPRCSAMLGGKYIAARRERPESMNVSGVEDINGGRWRGSAFEGNTYRN